MALTKVKSFVCLYNPNIVKKNSYRFTTRKSPKVPLNFVIFNAFSKNFPGGACPQTPLDLLAASPLASLIHSQMLWVRPP